MSNQLITISDILKSEADPKSRISIQAPTGTKIGDVVKYKPRNQYLIALSNEVHGLVLVQPQNCLMCLDKIILPSDVLQADLIKQGDVYGIQYTGKATNSDTPAIQPLDKSIALPDSLTESETDH